MKVLLFFFLALIPTLATAAGPLFVEGTTGNIPVRYQDPPIVLNFDLDMLAVAPTNAETDTLVLNALSLWNSVTTSTVNLTQGADMSVNVDVTNYSTFITASNNTAAAEDGLNPIIYDADGTIIDDFFGAGQSNQVVGFAVSSFFVGGSVYLEGYAVINGKDLGLTNTLTTLIVAHEIGHFIGLDHTLVDISELTVCSSNQTLYPLMYPFVCRVDQSLHQDDIISVSTLYPSTDIDQQWGQITGKFLQTNGAAVLGANIWAQNTTTNEVYSVVSDYLKEGTGFFSLYLPPGPYTLHANSIGTDFYGASGAGPYAGDLNDVSFQAPHPITAVNYEGSTAGSTETLTVTASQAIDVTFKLDGSGTAITGNTIFTPTTPGSGGDDGGMLAPAFLILLAIVMRLRFFHHRQSLHGLQ